MRNKTIDQSRLIAAALVILIHSPLPGVVGNIIESVARIAVPFFFMVSGYFAFGLERDRLKRQTVKTLKLLIWSVAVYFAWELLWSLYKGTTVTVLKTYFSLETLFETFVLNTGTLLGHLWFVLALLYCYIIYRLFYKSMPKVKLMVAIVLIISFFVIREILRNIGVSNTVYYLRNFLFIGMPFFLIGSIFAQTRIILKKSSKKALYFVALTGLILSISERLLIGACDLYIGTVLASVSLFLLSQSEDIPTSNFLASWGARFSRDIYVFHVIILGVINIAASLLGIITNVAFLSVRPILLFALCLAVLILKERFLQFFKRNKIRK